MSPWPMFEADDHKRAEWITTLREWHRQAVLDAKLWPWRRELCAVAERLERVLASYRSESSHSTM